MAEMTNAHVISDEYNNQCSYSKNGVDGTFTLKENSIHIKFSVNNIKIYEKDMTVKDFTGNVSSVGLNILYDMIFECVSQDDNNKIITVNENDKYIELSFDVFYGKNFSYNFQVVVPQKEANENDLLHMMSIMQNDIMELKCEINKLKDENKKLNEQVKNCGHSVINLRQDSNFVPLNTTTFNFCIESLYESETKVNLKQIQHMLNLDNLNVCVNSGVHTQCCDKCCFSKYNIALCNELKNEHATKLKITNSYCGNKKHKIERVKMFNLNNFPNVRVLSMRGNSPCLDYDYDSIVGELKHCDHKITHLFVYTHANLDYNEQTGYCEPMTTFKSPSMLMLETYCQENNIIFSSKNYNNNLDDIQTT